MPFYFTVTNNLYDVTVNASATEVTVLSTTRPVQLYTNATIVQSGGGGGGGITSATFATSTITNLIIPANGSIQFLSTLTTATATISSWERPNSPKFINIDGSLKAFDYLGTYGQFNTIIAGPPAPYETDAISVLGGNVTIAPSGENDGNLFVGKNITTLSGYYAGSVKVIDANGYWVGPAIKDNPQEKIDGITDTTQRQLDAFAVNQFDTAKYLIKVKDGAHIHIVEIILAYDGTNILKSEYGVITNNGALGTFTSDVISGQVRLLFTPSAPTNMSVRVEKTLMAV